VFDRNAGQTSTAATYAVKWLDQSVIPSLNPAVEASNSRKTRPEKIGLTDRSENQTGNGRKTRPDEQSENQTGIQITIINNTLKQQETAAAFEMLKAEGFDEKAARSLATRFDVARIDRQIQLLPRRQVKRNRLGMLRTAIEQDWPAPSLPPSTRINGQPPRLGAPNFAPRRTGQPFAAAVSDARQRLGLT
jgi:hypothetical protein